MPLKPPVGSEASLGEFGRDRARPSTCAPHPWRVRVRRGPPNRRATQRERSRLPLIGQPLDTWKQCQDQEREEVDGRLYQWNQRFRSRRRSDDLCEGHDKADKNKPREGQPRPRLLHPSQRHQNRHGRDRNHTRHGLFGWDGMRTEDERQYLGRNDHEENDDQSNPSLNDQGLVPALP